MPDPKKEREEDFLEDVDALAVRYVGTLKIGGKNYRVAHIRHIPVEDAIRIWNLERDRGDLSPFERDWAELKLLAPALPDTARSKLTQDVVERWLARGLRSTGPPADGGDAGRSSSGSSPNTGPSTPASAPAT